MKFSIYHSVYDCPCEHNSGKRKLNYDKVITSLYHIRLLLQLQLQSCPWLTVELPRLFEQIEVYQDLFVESGSNFTCQMFPTKVSFHSVIGATRRIGSTPISSELTTTTGRVYRISVPRVGLRSTNQISPRFGFIRKISCLPFGTFRFRLFVMVFHLFCLL